MIDMMILNKSVDLNQHMPKSNKTRDDRKVFIIYTLGDPGAWSRRIGGIL